MSVLPHVPHAPAARLPDPCSGRPDTRAPEWSLDRFARLAVRVAGAPAALVSWFGQGREWVAGEHVLPEALASTEDAPLARLFRRHAAGSDGPLAIEDARPHLLPGVGACLCLPLRAADGALAGLVCAVDTLPRRWAGEEIALLADVAASVEAEMRLRESEQRFRQMAESVREVFWITDVALSQMLYVSPAYDEIWGRSRETLYGDARLWLQSVHPADQARVIAAAVAGRRHGFDLEYRVVRPDGTVRWVRDRGFPVVDEEGRVYRMAGIAEDVTARREMEEQLLQSQKMEAVSRLAGGVAHNFNNVLTAIGGFAALLEDELEQDGSAAEYVLEIQEAASRAAEMTRQLLAFGRRQTLQARVIDINDVVRDAERMLRRMIPPDIGIALQLDAGAGQVRVDPTQMHQVLMNLAVNARDAMPQGGQLTIRTARERTTRPLPGSRRLPAPGDYVALSVQDTGRGMDPHTLARAFEPFFTRRAEGRGTGLGLATVEGIVAQSGGHIHAESQEGHGSTFTIYLPREAAAGAVDPPAPEVRAVRRGGGTILLAEDEATVRILARRVLTTAGYTVMEAGDGEEALRLFDQHGDAIDLLVTDVMMPRMGGKALTRAVHERRPVLPVVLMSGYSGEEVEGEASLPEGVAFLQKPFVPRVLAEMVARAIG